LSVVVAAVVLWLTGWRLADPIASVAVCVVIVAGSWQLISQSVNVLLEGSPARIDVPALMRAMRDVPGVRAVHDVHVWTITSGMDAMSGHVAVEELGDGQAVLGRLQTLLRERFRITHTTIPTTTSTSSSCPIAHLLIAWLFCKLDWLAARIATGIVVIHHPTAEIGADRHHADHREHQKQKQPSPFLGKRPR
jgi:hypothetical protein